MRGVDFSAMLQREGVLLSGHFVLKAGDHSDRYVHKDAVTDVLARWKFAQGLAALARRVGTRFDVVLGPTQAGAIWAQLTALALQQSIPTGGFDHLQFCYAEKETIPVYNEAGELAGHKETGKFVLRRGFDRLVMGASVILVEDIVTTGASVASVAQAVRACGGNVAAIVALCVRGTATAESLGVPHLSALVERHHIQAKTWSAEECAREGLCAQGVPINTEVGHGAVFLARKAQGG